VKLVGKEDPHIISKVYEMGIMGTPFSHKYLKFNLFLEKFKEGTIKSPVIVEVNMTFDLRSLAELTLSVYCSVKMPFFIDRALN
jgi:hypothetical protein